MFKCFDGLQLFLSIFCAQFRLIEWVHTDTLLLIDRIERLSEKSSSMKILLKKQKKTRTVNKTLIHKTVMILECFMCKNAVC